MAYEGQEDKTLPVSAGTPWRTTFWPKRTSPSPPNGRIQEFVSRCLIFDRNASYVCTYNAGVARTIIEFMITCLIS